MTRIMAFSPAYAGGVREEHIIPCESFEAIADGHITLAVRAEFDYGIYTVPVNGSIEMWWQESKLSGAADLDNGDVARDLGESI